MELLSYINPEDPSGGIIRQTVAGVPGVNAEILTDTALFSEALKRLPYPGNVLLALGTMEDFRFAVAAQELFRDIMLILILPDRSRKTVDMGYSLWPRYVAYPDGDFNDLRAVLTHMALVNTYGQQLSRSNL